MQLRHVRKQTPDFRIDNAGTKGAGSDARWLFTVIRFLAGASLLLLALAATGSTTSVQATVASTTPDALVIFHGYDGQTTIAGDLIQMQYTQGHLYAEITDLTADGIFRNGFEVMP